jgi:hypothetical protein
MRCVSTKIVIQLLIVDQNQYHLSVASDLLHSAETDEIFFKSFVTGDETWVYSYDHIHLLHWKTSSLPQPMKVHQVQYQTNMMCKLSPFPIKKALHTLSVFHKAKQTISFGICTMSP